MGQRLNLEVHYEGEVLANAYYHWSAYTSSSLEMLGIAIKAYNQRTEINPLRVAVEILQATGAGVDEAEKKQIAKDKTGKFSGIEFKDAVDRNKGLLAVTEKGIKDTRNWEEGRVTMDIGTEEFLFSVLWADDIEDYEDCMAPGAAEELTKIEDVGFDFTVPSPFRDFDKLAKAINDNPNGIRIDDNTILTWIE